MAPGVGHSAVGGVAPLDSVVLEQMVGWVERGVEPEVLHAQGVNKGGVFVRRELCLYPNIQRCDEDPDIPGEEACVCV